MIRSWKSPNFDKRAPGAKPRMIIIHYTGMQTDDAALTRLCDPDSKVSSHYFVGMDGTPLQLVDDDKRAWHAGISSWGAEKDINSASLGIEISNPGHEFVYREFNERQIQETIKICQRLIRKFAIAPKLVLGHSDIAPKRKEDPGELFPWKRLASEGIGIWPKVEPVDTAQAAALAGNEKNFRECLIKYGYSGDVPYDRMVTAFHRHFYPEAFAGGKNPGVPTKDSAARLLALLRMR